MFDNQSLRITFGPVGDILFMAFLILGTGVFAGIIINWVTIEFRELIARFTKDEEVEEDFDEMVEYATKDAEATSHVFRNERPEFVPVLKFPENDKTQEELYDRAVEAMKDFQVRPLIIDSEPKVEFHKTYIVQWGESENFAQFESTELRRTTNPGQTALELLAAYGPGHLRWRLAGDDNSTPEWKYQGHFYPDLTKETAHGNA